MKRVSDTTKVRKIIESYNYFVGRWYSEPRKNHRRIKAWVCEINDKDFEKITAELRKEFGDRFKCCYSRESASFCYPAISFIVEIK